MPSLASIFITAVVYLKILFLRFFYIYVVYSRLQQTTSVLFTLSEQYVIQLLQKTLQALHREQCISYQSLLYQTINKACLKKAIFLQVCIFIRNIFQHVSETTEASCFALD